MVKNKSLWSRALSVLRLADAKATAENEQTKVVVIRKNAVGSTGTAINGGLISEDYLKELHGSSKADIYDEMRRGDYQIKMCLAAVKNPILGANWEVEPADPTDPESVKDAELIRHILFDDMDQPTWKKVVGEALTCVEFGFSLMEIIHKAVVNHPKFGSYNGIKSLAFRSQRTIERWNVDQDGKLKSVSQQAVGDVARRVDIPAEFLLRFALGQEGSNYEGISILRPCYGPWLRKKVYAKLNAIGIEKFAVPTPIVKVPENKTDSPEFDKMVASIDSYTSHERGALYHPDGWDIQLHSNAYDPQKVEASIDNEDKRIAKAFMANFLELGMNAVGSYSLSNDLSDFFLGGLVYIAEEVAEPFNIALIPELVRMNRGPRAAYPKLKASGISDKAGKELAEIVKSYSDAGVIRADDQLEEHLRKRHGLPKADLATMRKSAPQPALPGATDTGMVPDDEEQEKPPKKTEKADNPEAEKDGADENESGQSLSERIRLAEKRRRALIHGSKGEGK